MVDAESLEKNDDDVVMVVVVKIGMEKYWLDRARAAGSSAEGAVGKNHIIIIFFSSTVIFAHGMHHRGKDDVIPPQP